MERGEGRKEVTREYKVLEREGERGREGGRGREGKEERR